MSRLLFVVQRYGREVAGGAELLGREFATRLAARGQRVEVVTTCALSYVDWANHYPPGTEVIDGVTVHRLPVAAPRDDRLFEALNSRVAWGQRPHPLYLEHAWMRAQGPLVPELVPWLLQRSGDYDVVSFFTYLYYTTWVGLPVAASIGPTILHPTAHDEPPLYLELYRTTFHHPSAFGFLTEEEAALVERRFRTRRPSEIIGVGIDVERHEGFDGDDFRRQFGLHDRPYLLFVGRVDPSKGSDELVDYFRAYKERNPGPLALAIVGDPVRPLDPHPDVVVTGFVDEAAKQSALAGALALVQPSYFESFSMILSEAWAHRKPALVQGHCDVLEGQCRRSGGGIPYRGFAEFEAAVDLLCDDGGLRARLGAAGRRYVEERYAWDAVLDRYDRLLTTARLAWPSRAYRARAGA
jgi:glycosyltransferase involved in cell wall biosynthesis